MLQTTFLSLTTPTNLYVWPVTTGPILVPPPKQGAKVLIIVISSEWGVNFFQVKTQGSLHCLAST